MPGRGRWRPRKRGAEDDGLSEWQPGGCAETTQKTEKPEIKIGKQLKKVKPPPDNLGCRHRALNTKVNDAFANKVDFDSEKNKTEVNEIDRLFKIDLAAKCKNVDYIVETLKSGDSLYTARVLNKCHWLFSDDYSNIINPEYLHENIFPFISMRLKRKIFKAAAKNITNPDRAVQFYHCCMKEKMKKSAFTCLLYTSEAFKIDVLQNMKEMVIELENKDTLYIRFFVGKSFNILKAFLDFLGTNWKISSTARQFKHLYYSVSNEDYLDIAEKYVSTYYGFQTDKFDAKLSESIMKNHKARVLENPKFYVNTLNTEVLVKYSTIDDAEMYATAILPNTGCEFWSRHHYSIFKPVFKMIPEENTYYFFKNFFEEHYPNTEFEMHREFYEQGYHKFMTTGEREEWALRHLKSQKQILGVGNDYLWYRFVNFELAFAEIKQLVSITKKAETRNSMLNILIETAQNDRQLESLFIYYYKRHAKELRTYKDKFINKVISNHNVFKFDKLCWAAFYELLLSIDLYDTADTEEDKYDYSNENDTYKYITVLYHILHDEPFPEELMIYFIEVFEVNSIYGYFHNIKEDNYQKLHDFFFDVYMKNLVEFKHQPHSGDVAAKVRRFFYNIKRSMNIFHEEKEPSETQPKRENKKKQRHISDRLSDRKLLRDLKKDKSLVVDQVTNVKTEYERDSEFKLNNFLRKIKIYFPEDMTKLYLGLFENLIHENKDLRSVKAGVHGIFDLGDETAKLDLMTKYKPSTTKIDRKTIDIGQLRVQKAICRFACISRPAIPLSSMEMYMKGSYARLCLCVFNTYLAILPLPMCLEFVHLVIDAPISIQKHAIRLAFKCFSTETLIEVISDIWEKTKNVSMRSVIYKALFNKVVETNTKMFADVLIKFTSSLHQNDENELFGLVVSNQLSEDFLGRYVEAAWGAVSFFENKKPNIQRKEDVINCIQDNLHLVSKSFVLEIIQQHLDMMIQNDDLKITYAGEDISRLYKKKWQLVAHFIMHYTRSDCSVDEYVQMSQYVIKNSINKWTEIIKGEFVYQKLVWDFYNNLKHASLHENTDYFEDGLPIFEEFLSSLNPPLPFQDAYILTWDLVLSIMTRRIVKGNKNSIQNDDLYEVVITTMKEFSKKLGEFVSLYAGRKMYFMSYSTNIREMVMEHAKHLLHVIYYFDRDDDEGEYLDDVSITLASGLVEFESPETYLLAVQLLPTDIKEDNENFMLVFDKIHKYVNPEVQFSLYQQFQELYITQENKT